MAAFSKLKSTVIQFCTKYRTYIFYILLVALILPEVTMYFHKPNRGLDLHGYVRAGQDALILEDLYRNSAPCINNTWPPFFSFFSIPLALSNNFLGLPVTKELWYFFNFAIFIATMQMMLLIILEKRPSFFRKSEFDFTSDLVFVPFFLILPGFIYNFFMLQINMLVLFFVTAGYLYYIREKQWKAGFLFALAASIKAYPALFLIYFIFRKQWKISGSILLWGVLLTISPVMFYGFERYYNLMVEWLSISFMQPFVIGYKSFNNQSLYAFWERLLAHQLHLTEPASAFIKIANLSSIILILTTVFYSILRFPYKRSSITGFIEFSCICTMMMIFPPIAWRHYWVLLLPASVSMYYCLKRTPQVFSSSVKFFFSTYIVLTAIPYFFSKAPFSIFLKFHSCYTFAALSMLAALLILHSNINLQDRKTVEISS